MSTSDVNKERWLDIGCGKEKTSGAIGIDHLPLPGVDIVHDLNRVPWPLPNNSFDHFVCKHSLSHLADLVQTVEEIYRLAKPGAIVEILAPHYASDNFNTDPTHKFHMGYRTFNYFCDNVPFKYHYYSKSRFELLERYMSFRACQTDFGRKRLANPFRWLGIEQLVNRVPRIYERFFVYWLPVSELYFKLRVIKEEA
jgi:predicted SAM-dependent methyltransferase